MLPKYPKLLAILLAALLKTSSSLAQAPPLPPPVPPPPAANTQPVSLRVPRGVSLLADVVDVLVSRNDGQGKVQTLLARRRERSRKGQQTIDFTVPKNALTRTLGLVE